MSQEFKVTNSEEQTGIDLILTKLRVNVSGSLNIKANFVVPFQFPVFVIHTLDVKLKGIS